MHKVYLDAGSAVAAVIPSFALAQSRCDQQHDNRVAGTVSGSGLAATVAAAVALRGDKGVTTLPRG